MYDRLVGLNPDKPFVIPYVNPITPLILNAETSLKMDLAIEMGLPLIFSNYGMSGATCPITPGGTLALLTAELLAGLVYAQLKKEGAPIVLGSLPASFNMKSTGSYYTSDGMLVNLCCAEMMAHYRIPHCGSSGGWMGWGPDLMAASMLWFNHLTSQLGKVGLVPFVGSNFDSLVFSPSTAVYAAEVIRFAREFKGGFSLEDREMGLDEIVNLGPGASYLTSPLTMKHYRNQPPLSRIWPVLSLEKWEKQGRPKAGPVLREHTKQLLDEAKPPEDHDRILAAGEEFVTEWR
jgi:trimethylamine--corrinoid protein Co-methyltransferase